MNLTSSISYLSEHPRHPKPHAREGIRIVRQFNSTTERMTDEVLMRILVAELERVLPANDGIGRDVSPLTGGM